ncbi:MAG: prenyltransferase [Coriobacteriia bacterium]|nr:prenyltransferase [Coriobacteriia bacterium]
MSQRGSRGRQSIYKPFTAKAAIELASPPTWSAALSPVLVGGAAAWALTAVVPFQFDARAITCWLLMLVCALCAQSAVNTLNDYQDFKSGLDTKETILDKTDASILYNAIDPKAALAFGVVLCLLAVGFGVVVALLSQWWLLLLGALGAAAVVFYSLGPKPISYLPLGEAVSGLAMGGIITVSTYVALTKKFTPLIILISLPAVLAIALIMLTNNSCDIVRDREAGRRTLAVKLGSEKSKRLAGILAVVTMLWMAMASVMFWLVALVPVSLASMLGYKKLSLIIRGNYDIQNRQAMMSNISSWCFLVNSCWAGGLLASGLIGMWFA